MANNLTNVAETEALKWFIGLTPSYVPGALKFALLTTAPSGDDGVTGAVEVSSSGTAYARTVIPWSTPSNGVVTNSADITFPTAIANWGTIVAGQIWNASGTFCVAAGSAIAPVTINNGQTYKIAAGSLIFSID